MIPELEDKIKELEELISSKTILIMYEPGAGGDFLTTLLSFSDSIYGKDVNVKYFPNGRIKTLPVRNYDYQFETIFNDYEFFKYDNILELIYNNLNLMIEQENNRKDAIYISKLHPYIFKYGKGILEKLDRTLRTRYKNSKKILLTRGTYYCHENHRIKNTNNTKRMDVNIKIDMYSDEWFDIFNMLPNSDDIHKVEFLNILDNPLNTLNTISELTNIVTPVKYRKKIYDVIKEYRQHQQSIETILS